MKINIPGKNLKSVLHAPHVSEKATTLSQQNQYVFHVTRNSNKKQVRLAIEKYYDVKVTAVNLLNMRGKPKGMGRYKGYRRNWEKAYVTLAEGNTITSSISE